jgi:phospholipid-translocating ATPase
VIFTSLPILAVGIFEQDVSEEISVKIPLLYGAGPKSKFFSNRQFALSLLKGVYHSLVLFFTFYLSLGDGYEVWFMYVRRSLVINH